MNEIEADDIGFPAKGGHRRRARASENSVLTSGTERWISHYEGEISISSRPVNTRGPSLVDVFDFRATTFLAVGYKPVTEDMDEDDSNGNENEEGVSEIHTLIDKAAFSAKDFFRTSPFFAQMKELVTAQKEQNEELKELVKMQTDQLKTQNEQSNSKIDKLEQKLQLFFDSLKA
ncbi:hypothetical protein LXL04_005379 [Taraxacum kok-saghyz]